MSADVRGGITVLPHVQAFADSLASEGLANSFGTYPGHEPTPERAIDVFVPVNDAGPGNEVCQYALKNWDYYGLYYIIFRQRIYNPSVANYWRDMEDRGGVTQNHFDHVHCSFYETGEAKPNEEEDTLSQADIDGINHRLDRLSGQVTNIYAYLFNDRKGEDRNGAGLDNTDLQTNAAVDEIRKEVGKLRQDFEGVNVAGVNQQQIIDGVVEKLVKRLRGAV